jgi:hypothetical protein
MGVLGPIGLLQPAGSVTILQLQNSQRRAVRSQLIGDDGLWMDSSVHEQATQQLQRRVFVAALLHQDIQHFAFVVDGAPQVHSPPADPDDRFVQMPAACRRSATGAGSQR